MKYVWNGINTALIFMCFIYVFISKDINTTAYDKCEKLEQIVKLQEERCNHLSEIVTQKDTIIVNIKNYTNIYKDE